MIYRQILAPGVASEPGDARQDDAEPVDPIEGGVLAHMPAIINA